MTEKHLTCEDIRANILACAESRNLTLNKETGKYEGLTMSLHDIAPKYSIGEVAEIAWIDIGGAGERKYRTVAKLMADELRKERRREMAELLANSDDQYGLCAAELKLFIKLLARADTPQEQLDYYYVGWKQLIWQCKRKLLGKPTSWDVMLSLVSRTQGSGKTESCKRFGWLLSEFFMPDADCDLLSDKFRIQSLERFYLVLLDEFDKADKTQLTTFKRLITSESVSGRRIYSDSEVSVTQNASFIVTSNRSIAFDIQDSSMRRFVEMRCREERVDDAFIDRMAELRWDRIWGVADGHDDVAPASEHAELMRKYQDQLTSESDFDAWRTERILERPDNENLKLSLGTLYTDYGEWMRNQSMRPISRRKFAKEIQEAYDTYKPGNILHARGVMIASVAQ